MVLSGRHFPIDNIRTVPSATRVYYFTIFFDVVVVVVEIVKLLLSFYDYKCSLEKRGPSNQGWLEGQLYLCSIKN